MKEETKTQIFKIVFIILFFIYTCLYSLERSGYYTNEIRRKTMLTNEQIQKFEEDIKNGENIDMNVYLDSQTKDYSNKLSKFGYRVSTELNNILTGGINEISNVIKKLIT